MIDERLVVTFSNASLMLLLYVSYVLVGLFQ